MKRVMLTRPDRSLRSEAYVRGSTPPNVAKIAVETKQLGDHTTTPHPLPFRGRGGGGDTPVKEKEKNNVSLADLLSLADQLPATERKTLLAHLALRGQTDESGQTRDKDMWAHAVYNEIVRAFGADGGAGQGPALVKRTLSATAVWAPVADFMRASKLDALTVTERQSVYGMLAKLVVEQALYVARNIGAPLGVKLVANAASNMAAIFDRSFPGYLQAGLAPIVARQLVGQRPH